MKTITKSKKQVSSCDIREGYYQLSDGEINLADAIQNDPATKDDPKLAEAIKMLRAPVGDKYVLEEMQKAGAVLGGEQSGHIILSDFATTGDGLVAALQVLAVLAQGEGSRERLIRLTAVHLVPPRDHYLKTQEALLP